VLPSGLTFFGTPSAIIFFSAAISAGRRSIEGILALPAKDGDRQML
jgi:hypothetical protein